MKKRPADNPLAYQQRSYRQLADTEGLISTIVQVRETDLHVLAPVDVRQEVERLVLQLRAQIEHHIARHPAFLKALSPLPADPLAPAIVREMLRAGQLAGVGPMAAVAGAVAEGVGKALIKQGVGEVMVENGGDLYFKRQRDATVAIFAGPSPLSNRLGIRIPKELMPLGVCTSSGTVGHSLSFGKADAVTVLSASTALADAVATRVGNEVRAGQPLEPAISVARAIDGVLGVVIVQGENIGAWGQVELVGLA